MKTPAEWLALIKQASEREVRHGSTVFLTEADIESIMSEAWRLGWQDGMSDASAITNSFKESWKLTRVTPWEVANNLLERD